jgi:gamma-glutamylcyclotransferase (GGCT)/AIG2-like uncharacterized protein YtfP
MVHDRDSLFVYGSLLFPEVLLAVLGRVPAGSQGTVEGWRVAALPGRTYPGLVPSDGRTAVGRVLAGLSRDEWQLLDAFEGDAYDLCRLTLADGRPSWAYVWVDELQVSPADWSAEHFAAQHLSAFASRVVDARRVIHIRPVTN